ncbi:MAG TPA: hypothetical protein VI384_08190 [Candidatus Dormibacteraeota bacterium]
MSKRITTTWYIGAWIVWALGVAAMFLLSRATQSSSTPPTGIFFVYLAMFIAMVVMLATWLAALVKLATQRAWGWFVAVGVLHLVGLGIIGMAAYAMAGPEAERAEVVYRPTAT